VGVIAGVRAFGMTPESRSSAVDVSQERRHPVCGGLPSQKRNGVWELRGCARGSFQLQKSTSGTWPESSGE